MSFSHTETFALTLDFYEMSSADFTLRGKYLLALYEAFSSLTEAFLDGLVINTQLTAANI